MKKWSKAVYAEMVARDIGCSVDVVLDRLRKLARMGLLEALVDGQGRECFGPTREGWRVFKGFRAEQN